VVINNRSIFFDMRIFFLKDDIFWLVLKLEKFSYKVRIIS
jgi:hypothetical protein